MFTKAKEFIKKTESVLGKIGNAYDEAHPVENHETDMGFAWLMLKQGIQSGNLPEGCPEDFDLEALAHLINLENELRTYGVRL